MSDFLPGLKAALHAATTGKGEAGPLTRARNCTMCIVIEHAAPGGAREALVDAAAGRISGRALHRSLRAVGVTISREAISAHRNEDHRP